MDAVITTPAGWIFAGVWGALWGSFFNVCIYRVGLYESVVKLRSRCPNCGILVRGIDNVPVLSWIWLRARCRGCGVPISARYPLVELLSALLVIGLWWRLAPNAPDALSAILHFLLYFAFAGTLLVLAGI